MNIISPLFGLLHFVIDVYTFILIGRAVISWVNPDPHNAIVQTLYRLTEPVLYPVRKMLSGITGNVGIDFSPFLVIIFLRMFRRFL